MDAESEAAPGVGAVVGDAVADGVKVETLSRTLSFLGLDVGICGNSINSKALPAPRKFVTAEEKTTMPMTEDGTLRGTFAAPRYDEIRDYFYIWALSCYKSAFCIKTNRMLFRRWGEVGKSRNTIPVQKNYIRQWQAAMPLLLRA